LQLKNLSVTKFTKDSTFFLTLFSDVLQTIYILNNFFFWKQKLFIAVFSGKFS